MWGVVADDKFVIPIVKLMSVFSLPTSDELASRRDLAVYQFHNKDN